MNTKICSAYVSTNNRLLFPAIGLKVKCFLPWTPESEILRDRTHSRGSTNNLIRRIKTEEGRVRHIERDRPLHEWPCCRFVRRHRLLTHRSLCYGQRPPAPKLHPIQTLTKMYMVLNSVFMRLLTLKFMFFWGSSLFFYTRSFFCVPPPPPPPPHTLHKLLI